MKTNTSYPRVPTRFGREVRFELTPSFEPLGFDPQRRAFENLKSRLLEPVLDRTADPALHRQLQLAANEAAAVAFTTPFPLLVLPVLLQEKADEVHRHAARQEQVERASPRLAAAEAAA